MKLFISDLYQRLMKIKKAEKTFLLAIDGCGGAGKSTLAQAFKEIDPNNVTVIHMDDFYKPSKLRELVTTDKIGGNWDCERVKNQILLPLSKNQPTKYQRYDWDQDEMAEWHHVPAGGLVIIEGCYSLINHLNAFYDFKIWVDSPRDVRLTRGIERDGEGKRHLWENLWMPAEEQYINEQQPMNTVDLIVDGTGKASNIEKLEITVLKGF